MPAAAGASPCRTARLGLDFFCVGSAIRVAAGRRAKVMTSNRMRHVIPPGVILFTGERSRRGYRLNKLAVAMRDADNRASMRADEEAFMARMGLSDEEKRMVRQRDLVAMLAYGGTMFALVKLAAVLDMNLLEAGASMRGETVAEFLATRPFRPGDAPEEA